MALQSNIVGTTLLSQTILTEIADIIAEHIVVCNYSELAFLINDYLESKNLPTFKEKDFVKFLKGKEVPAEMAMSPEFILLEKLIKRALIREKRDLMDMYKTTTDWKDMKRGEFLFATRFANFGQEEAESNVQLEGGAHITINIDNRKVELSNPITSEIQMLDTSEEAVQKYLGKRGLLIEDED